MTPQEERARREAKLRSQIQDGHVSGEDVLPFLREFGSADEWMAYHDGWHAESLGGVFDERPTAMLRALFEAGKTHRRAVRATS